MFKFGLQTGRRGPVSESAWPLLTKEPGGGALCANPRLSCVRGTSAHTGARSGVTIKLSDPHREVRAKSVWDRNRIRAPG